jgi:hypothetical protein
LLTGGRYSEVAVRTGLTVLLSLLLLVNLPVLETFNLFNNLILEMVRIAHHISSVILSIILTRN